MAVLVIDQRYYMPRIHLRLCLRQGINRRRYLRHILLAICSIGSSKLGFSSVSYLPLSTESNIELSEIIS